MGKRNTINIDATQTYSGGITFESGIEAQSCHITADTTISGQVTVNGDFKVNRLIISSNVTVSGQLIVNGNIDIRELLITETGYLVMSGNLTCTSMKIHKLKAKGPATFSGLVTAHNDFTVDNLETTTGFYPNMASGKFVVTGNRAG